MATIVVFATQGSHGNDIARITSLFQSFSPEIFPFDSKKKFSSAMLLLTRILSKKPTLLVMEGTGIGGGIPLIACKILLKIPYIVSTGDAVAPFLSNRYPRFRWLFEIYEKLLFKFSQGTIGWTPYLVGRALTYGSPRGITAAGWSPFQLESSREETRKQIRSALKIPLESTVIGIAGSLNWDFRNSYCYGAELIRALRHSKKKNFTVLIVGGGSGLSKLQELAKGLPPSQVIFTSNIPQQEVLRYLCALDIASLPQSCDSIGNFRYSTKLSEYDAIGLPIAVGEIPLSYDLNEKGMWRIPGKSPWDETYVAALADLMDRLTPQEIEKNRPDPQQYGCIFKKEDQIHRVGNFIRDLLSTLPSSP